jgi:hypothetical protein
MTLHWKEWPNSNCPRCQAPEESTTHVWLCPDPEANFLWEKSLRQLKNWMLTQRTPVLLAQIICERLSAWRSNTIPTLKATPYSQLVKVLKLQDAMGWQSFFEGTPALGWSRYMDLHYNSIGSNITILLGATGMVAIGYLQSSKSCGTLLGICGSIEME